MLCFLCLVLLSNTTVNAYAEEHLELIDDSRIDIDGNLEEWATTRHSAEYLVKGLIANTRDFDGGLRVMFSKDWIYIGIDGRDDILQTGRHEDLIEIHFANQKKRKHKIFSLKIGELLNSSTLKLLRGRSKVQGALVKSSFFPEGELGGRYSIEVRIPMREMSWVFGSPVRLNVMFTDHDPDGEESIYTTHFNNRNGISDEITFIFGGARIFRSVYQQQGGVTLAEFSHDWVGDERDELLVVTTDEIILFGRQVRRGSGYTRKVHGLPLTATSIIKVEGEKPKRKVVLSYQKKSAGDHSKSYVVAYRLKRGRLVRTKP